MDINKSLKEEVEIMYFVLNKERENYNQLKIKMKTIETNYYSLLYAKKHFTKDIDNIYENLYEMDCRISQNNQYSWRENLIITGIPNAVHQQDLESTVLNI